MPAITITDVSKRTSSASRSSLRRLLGRFRLRRLSTAAAPAGHGCALRDLSLTIGAGESIGVMGRNGAGKTTLMRLLAGVTLPTEGRIRVEGTIAALIGLGIGFHRQSPAARTGPLRRADGLSRPRGARACRRQLAFADLGEYADVAFKRCSSA